MKSQKRRRDMLRAHCEAFDEHDGIDPRDDARQGRSDRWQGRKCLQLCRQIAETLDLVLSGECDDEVLQNLQVVSVVPAPNASRLLVTVVCDVADGPTDSQAVLERLERQSARLRCEVAGAIHRRRTPTLAFQVLGR